MRLEFETGEFNVAYITLVPAVSDATPTPFGGRPAAIPGTIVAANFDEGSEAVAYHDDSPATPEMHNGRATST